MYVCMNNCSYKYSKYKLIWIRALTLNVCLVKNRKYLPFSMSTKCYIPLDSHRKLQNFNIRTTEETNPRKRLISHFIFKPSKKKNYFQVFDRKVYTKDISETEKKKS